MDLSCGRKCTNPEVLEAFAAGRSELESGAIASGCTVNTGAIVCRELFKLPNSESYACPAHIRDSIITLPSEEYDPTPADLSLSFISPNLVQGFRFVQPSDVRP